MKNKNVGFLITGISIVIVIIIFIFNNGLKRITAETCTHGSACSMYDTIAVQTGVSLAIALLILIVGLFLIFSREEKEIIVKTKTIKEKAKKKKIDLKGLEEIEKEVIKLLQKENGGMFQRDLMERLEIGKVKTTRILDKLEAKQFIERKRRGMNNFVFLKQ